MGSGRLSPIKAKRVEKPKGTFIETHAKRQIPVDFHAIEANFRADKRTATMQCIRILEHFVPLFREERNFSTIARTFFPNKEIIGKACLLLAANPSREALAFAEAALANFPKGTENSIMHEELLQLRSALLRHFPR